MRLFWIAGVSLTLAGCFADPESVEDDAGGGSTAETNSASDPSTSGDTVDATAPTSGSGQMVDSSDSGEPMCETIRANVAELDTDVVIVVDPNVFSGGDTSTLLEGIATWDAFDVNYALFVPESLETSPLSPECAMGCGGPEPSCTEMAESVVVPYPSDAPPPGGPLALLVAQDDAFDCMLRPDDGPSAPTRHIIYLAETSERTVPDGVIDWLLNNDVRLHAACPGCGFEGNSDLEDTVFELGGLLADTRTDGDVGALISFVGLPRIQCDWPPAVPNGYDDGELEVSISLPLWSDDEIELEEVAGLDACDDEAADDWYRATNGNVQLCPATCFVSQFDVHEDVAVTHSACR